MSIPNLFTFGRKELSQDAFIAWLLSWAEESHCGTDNHALHLAGKRFLDALLEKADVTSPASVIKIDIRQQEKSIDVLAIIDKKIALLIEDKTGTSEHGVQLESYRDYVSALIIAAPVA